jgi:hypothetical protein
MVRVMTLILNSPLTLLNPMKFSISLLSTLFLLAAPGIALANMHGGAMHHNDPSGTWLDEETNWNKVGSVMPQAPTYADGNNLANCDQSFRQATLPEDAMVEAAGWTLSGPAQVFNGTTVITAMANADGMCRPLDYQVFVFRDGEFAGTLSPRVMDSRTDGSLYSVDLYGADNLRASFNRYTPEDPLCCASGESWLFYTIDTEGDGPVVMPQLPADTMTNDDVSE